MEKGQVNHRTSKYIVYFNKTPFSPTMIRCSYESQTTIQILKGTIHTKSYNVNRNSSVYSFFSYAIAQPANTGENYHKIMFFVKRKCEDNVLFIVMKFY